MAAWQLAQLNISLPREPLESALLADFVAALEPVNAAADAAPGFVWRLQTDDGDATAVRLADERLIVNLSLWESVEALRAFVSSPPHLAVLRRRREWFEALGEQQLVLWWTAPGDPPGIDEAQRRLATLRRVGPSAEAFTLREQFPRPGGAQTTAGPASETANSASASLNQPRSSRPAAS